MTKASRELDALVAEKVMGHKVKFEKGEPCVWQNDEPVMWNPNDYVLLNEDGSVAQLMYIPGGYAAWVIERYSENIESAWKVLEKLRDKYTNVALHAANGWGLSLGSIKVSDDGKVTEEWTEPIPAETAPLAICLAALAALDGEGLS